MEIKTINWWPHNDEKLLKKYKAICTKIEDWKNAKLNALPVYDDRYIKNKIITYSDQNYPIFAD